MATTVEVREEERAARREWREQQRTERMREQASQAQANGKLATIIREELSRPRAKRCRCGLHPRMRRADLDALGEGCTHEANGYICPVLDTVRRRLDR